MLPLVAGVVGMAVPDRHLPAVQRGPAERARVGRRDVDRHRARPRPPRDARPPRARQGAPLRPHDLRRRRPRRPARDRRRLQRADQRAAAGAGRGGVRAAAGGAPGRCGAARCTSPSGSPCGSRWRRAASTRSSPGWSSGCPPRRTRRAATRWSRRPGACASSASSRRPSWCARPRPSLTATLSPNARLQSFYHPWTSFVIVPLFALANAGVVLSGDVLATRVHRAGHARRARRVRGRQAAGRGGDGVGGDADVPRPDPAARRLGRGAGQRDDRRGRLHRRAAHRHARVPGGGARPGEGRGALGRRRVRGADLAGVPADRRCSRPRPRRGRWSATWPTSRTSCPRSTPTTTTSAARRAPRSR